jgi:hypothetical protein
MIAPFSMSPTWWFYAFIIICSSIVLLFILAIYAAYKYPGEAKTSQSLITPVIPEDQLIIGEFYYGKGRFVKNIALWDGQMFHGFQCKFSQYMNTGAYYGERGFSPLKHINTGSLK